MIHNNKIDVGLTITNDGPAGAPLPRGSIMANMAFTMPITSQQSARRSLSPHTLTEGNG